jgi:D-alanyl-D-alanine carboxypeptidase/D-alanyl-D-alanine-endopeptidase (penicillin-binding protein 4)
LDRAALGIALDAAINSHPTARRTTVTLKVLDLESGEVLYDRGGGRLLTPASNLKIYTAACALDLFGAEHRFTTTVRAGGEIRDGVLRGNLELVGGGDAMFTSKDLAALADRVVDEWGVKRIAGRVAVDNSRYSPRLKGPGWMWDDEPEYYNMSVTPMMVDFNVLTVRLTRRRDKLVAELAPPANYPRIRRMETKKGDSTARVTRAPFTDDLQLFEGDINEAEQRLTMHDPGPWVASLMTRMLKDRGVSFEERSSPAEGEPAGKDHRELTHRGKTLAETLKHFHEESENAVGELLLHEIAIAKGRTQPDWPAGAKAISDWLVEKAGLEAGSFRLVDGSGLSRYNLISAASAVRLLEFLHGSEHFDVFFASLPSEKVDGDVAVWAKGGSMTGVSTISGYLKTADGRLLAFSLLANGFVGENKPVFDLRQRVWGELVRYRQ